MEEDYNELFDLYLEDIADEKAMPEDFILSSGVIFLSNSSTVPSKVKAHTLAFALPVTKEQAESDVESNLVDILESVIDKSISKEVLDKSMEDFLQAKKTEGSLEDYMKFLVIRSSGLPETIAKKWVMAQE